MSMLKPSIINISLPELRYTMADLLAYTTLTPEDLQSVEDFVQFLKLNQ
jgi:hypothetical protein